MASHQVIAVPEVLMRCWGTAPKPGHPWTWPQSPMAFCQISWLVLTE